MTNTGLLISILGVVIGLIGIFIGLRFKRKRLIIYSTPIRKQIFSNVFVDVENFNLRLNDKPVRDLYFIELHIQNKGNETIYEKDFLRPLKLTFDENVKLFPINYVRKNSDIDVKYEYGEESGKTYFEIFTELIEPGDILIFQIMYENNKASDFTLDGRIVNGKIKFYYKMYFEESSRDTISKLTAGKYKERMRSNSMLLTLIFLAIVIYLGKILFPGFDPTKDNPFYIDILYFFIFFIIFIIISSIAMLIVMKYYKKIVDKEIKEKEEFIEKRELKLKK